MKNSFLGGLFGKNDYKQEPIPETYNNSYSGSVVSNYGNSASYQSTPQPAAQPSYDHLVYEFISEMIYKYSVKQTLTQNDVYDFMNDLSNYKTVMTKYKNLNLEKWYSKVFVDLTSGKNLDKHLKDFKNKLNESR